MNIHVNSAVGDWKPFRLSQWKFVGDAAQVFSHLNKTKIFSTGGTCAGQLNHTILPEMAWVLKGPLKNYVTLSLLIFYPPPPPSSPTCHALYSFICITLITLHHTAPSPPKALRNFWTAPNLQKSSAKGGGLRWTVSVNKQVMFWKAHPWQCSETKKGLWPRSQNIYIAEVVIMSV